MTEGSQTKKQNLDLALIGNSCAAAFVDRNARIVWWCFPHFDSDPVFSRLLAGDEEKGFCDVTLANLVETESRYMRNTAIVETILTDADGGKVRVADFAPEFRAVRARLQAPADHPADRTPRWPASRHDPGAPDPQLRPSDDQFRRRVQSHPLSRRRAGSAPARATRRFPISSTRSRFP